MKGTCIAKTVYKKAMLMMVLLLGTTFSVSAQCTLNVSLSASNNSICSGNNVILTATVTAGTPPYTYVWSTGETTSSISINKGNTYTVSVSDKTSGCQPQTASITIAETPTPGAPTAANAVVCKNNNATLQATAPGGVYQWYNAPVGGKFLFTGDTYITPPITAPTTFYVQTTIGGCPSARSPVRVTLSGSPSVAGAQICAGNQAVLSAAGADDYAWYDAPNGNLIINGNPFTTPPLTTTTTYYVVAQVNGCTSAPTPVTATVIPYPQTPVTSNVAICSGNPANLHAQAGRVIDWFDSPTSTTSLITSPDYTTPILTTTTTYYVQNSSKGCASPRVAVTVTVNPVPDAPTVQPASICAGNSVLLMATSQSGGTYNWYADADGANFITNANSYQTPVLNTTTTYYVQTVNGICSSGLTPVQVTVTANPPAPTVSVTPVCSATSATLTAIAPGGSYEWYDTATGTTPIYSGNPFTTLPLTTNTTYYVQTTVNGCTSPRTAVTATVLPVPAPPASNDATACAGSTVTLIASGAANYQWYDAAVGGNLLTAGNVHIELGLTASTIFYVQTTSSNGCASTRTPVNVIINPIPVQPTVSGGTTICPGGSVTLTASVPAGGTVSWYDVSAGGTPLYTATTYTTPPIFATTTYYAENSEGGCTSARAAITVSTVPIVYPQYQYASSTYCTSNPNIFPVIADAAGGTFSAPAGLVFTNPTTGEINVGASTPGKYTITFVGNESCHGVTQSVMNIVVTPDASFSYNGPFCQYAGTNPAPQFTLISSAGNFTVAESGLVFSATGAGVIDLQKTTPGTYHITNAIPASGACPAVQVTATVIIGAGVSVNAGPDQTIKQGNTAQLNGSIAGGVGGTWSGGTGSFSSTTISNPVYTPGASETSATLTLTTGTPSGGCGAKSDQVVITIIPKPTAPTASGATICSGNSVTLSATAPGGSYEWYDAAAGGTLLSRGPNFTIANLTASTDYFVQTTISGNTSNRTKVTVIVNPIPLIPLTTANVSACFNTTATLTATGSSGNYEWYDAPVGGTKLISSGNGSTFTTPAITSDISYYVQAIANGCPSTRAKVDVTVTQAPVITSAPAATICSGDLLNYTITSNIPTAVYGWGRPQVAGISNAAVANHTSGNINETLINTGTTYVDVVYNITAATNSCTTVFQYAVRVYPSATVTSANKLTICTDNSLNYDITFDKAVNSFSWSRAAVTGINNPAISGQAPSTIKEILHNTTIAPIDVTYVINYSLGNCSGAFNLVVTVNPAVNINSPDVIAACNGTAINYAIASNVPTATFNWSRAAIAGVSNPAANNQTSSTINETLVNTSGNTVNVPYIITPTAYGCQGPDFLLIVVLNPTPAAPVANANSPVCEGSTIRLQTAIVNNAVYLWKGPNGFTSGLQNPEINNVTQANAGTYSLNVIISGCPSPATTVNVQVNAPPIANAGPDQTICVTQNQVNLAGSVTGGTTTGIWSTSGTGTFSPSNGQLNVQYLPSPQDIAGGFVKLTLSSTSKDDCNIATSTATITFAPTPAVDAGADQDVCSQNTTVQLNGSLLKPGSATWTTSGTGTFNPSASLPNAEYLPSIADIQSGLVTLTLTYANAGICDVPTDVTTLKFIPPPTVYAGGLRYVLKGKTITLQPTVSDNNVQYFWTPDVFIDDNTAKNPVITGDIDRMYTLTVTDSRGCVSQDSAMVIVAPELVINNTFTPNGDGVNDVWNITGIVAYTDAVVDIFDRYGGVVYHSIGYPKAWDGTYNGKPVPVATYYYVIKLNVNGRILSGPVTVIR